MRAIIRFSINGEGKDSYLAMAVRGLLEANGFQRRGTASWENDNIPMATLQAVMNQFWTMAANPQSVPKVKAGVTVDHVWFYVDLPE